MVDPDLPTARATARLYKLSTLGLNGSKLRYITLYQFVFGLYLAFELIQVAPEDFLQHVMCDTAYLFDDLRGQGMISQQFDKMIKRLAHCETNLSRTSWTLLAISSALGPLIYQLLTMPPLRCLSTLPLSSG